MPPHLCVFPSFLAVLSSWHGPLIFKPQITLYLPWNSPWLPQACRWISVPTALCTLYVTPFCTHQMRPPCGQGVCVSPSCCAHCGLVPDPELVVLNIYWAGSSPDHAVLLWYAFLPCARLLGHHPCWKSVVGGSSGSVSESPFKRCSLRIEPIILFPCWVSNA